MREAQGEEDRGGKRCRKAGEISEARKLDREEDPKAAKRHAHRRDGETELRLREAGRAERKQEDRNSEARPRSGPPPARCPAQT